MTILPLFNIINCCCERHYQLLPVCCCVNTTWVSLLHSMRDIFSDVDGSLVLDIVGSVAVLFFVRYRFNRDKHSF